MSKLYEASDIIKLFNKLEKKVEELYCFIKDCCAKIPVNIGTGIGIFKRFNANKWEFKSLLPINNKQFQDYEFFEFMDEYSYEFQGN